jgi:hypothetical protein
MKLTRGKRGSKFEWATSLEAPSRQSKRFNCKFANSTADVAPNTYPTPILVVSVPQISEEQLLYNLI